MTTAKACNDELPAVLHGPNEELESAKPFETVLHGLPSSEAVEGASHQRKPQKQPLRGMMVVA